MRIHKTVAWAAAIAAACPTAIAATDPYPTTTTLASNSNPSVTGQILTLTATVKPTSNLPLPTGNVTFYDQGASIGTGKLDATGHATYITACLSKGTHSLNARYDGAPTYKPSASTPFAQSVNARLDDKSTGRLQWGVNVHLPAEQWAATANAIVPRGLMTTRLNVWVHDPASVSRIRTQVMNLASRGIKSELVVFNGYSPQYVAPSACNVDLQALEQTVYNQTLNALPQLSDVTLDFELQNEVPWNRDNGIWLTDTSGRHASDFDTPCGRYQAANMRGMSRAIATERQRVGRPLRVIIGSVDRLVGFYDFMLGQGVNFDVVGYHRYPYETQGPLDAQTDTWFGPGGALGQLARFNRPVHVNEFNCGEIYSGAFDGTANQVNTEACYRSLAMHLKELANQTQVNLDGLLFYELADEPGALKPAERHFGLLTDLASPPKVSMLLASAFAGGALSQSEANELTSRQLLTQEQITGWKSCGARP